MQGSPRSSCQAVPEMGGKVTSPPEHTSSRLTLVPRTCAWRKFLCYDVLKNSCQIVRAAGAKVVTNKTVTANHQHIIKNTGL